MQNHAGGGTGGSRIWLIICMLVQLGALLSNMVVFWLKSLLCVPQGVHSGAIFVPFHTEILAMFSSVFLKTFAKQTRNDQPA